MSYVYINRNLNIQTRFESKTERQCFHRHLFMKMTVGLWWKLMKTDATAYLKQTSWYNNIIQQFTVLIMKCQYLLVK